MNLSSRAIEAGARALFDAMPLTSGEFCDLSETHQNHLRDSAKAFLSALAAEGMVLVPKSALDWLHGEAPDADGLWFGDGEASHNGRFWWRSKFRAMLSAHQEDEKSEGK